MIIELKEDEWCTGMRIFEGLILNLYKRNFEKEMIWLGDSEKEGRKDLVDGRVGVVPNKMLLWHEQFRCVMVDAVPIINRSLFGLSIIQNQILLLASP